MNTTKKKAEETFEPFDTPSTDDVAAPHQGGRGREIKIGVAVLVLVLVAAGYVVATQMLSNEPDQVVAEEEEGDLGVRDGGVFAGLSADAIPAVVRPEAEPQASPLMPAQWNAVQEKVKTAAAPASPVEPSIPPMPLPSPAAMSERDAGGLSADAAAKQGGEPGATPPTDSENVSGLADSSTSSGASIGQSPLAWPNAPASAYSPSALSGAATPGGSHEPPSTGWQNPAPVSAPAYPAPAGPSFALRPDATPTAETPLRASSVPSIDATDAEVGSPEPLVAARGGSFASLPQSPAPSLNPPARTAPVEYVGLSAQSQPTAERVAAAAPPGDWQQPLVNAVDGKYTAGPNDSFYTISRKVYGSGAYFRALAQHNRQEVPEADSIRIGQVVAVPPVEQLEARYPSLCPKPDHRDAAKSRSLAAAAQPLRGRVYVVQEGDTLFDIARHELGSRARVAELIELNREVLGRQINYLTPGMRLLLPDDDDRAPAVTQRPTGGSLR